MMCVGLVSHCNMPHFVLVHGGSGGAWFWFKIVDLLQKSGHKVSAIDLAASGIDSRSHADISSFEDYSKPLLDFMASVPENEKVVLVGHSWGCLNIANATELFPHKVAIGVYVAGPMRSEDLGERTGLDLTGADRHMVDLFYGNGTTNPPTGMLMKPEYSRETAYHLTSSEDFVLGSLLGRPVPLAIARPIFTTTEENYGSVPRVYIKTLQDRALSAELQDSFVSGHPFPNLKEVLSIDSDHAVALSAPSQLHDLLVQIGGSC